MTSKELRERLNTMAAADVSRDIPRLIADAITALESAEASIAELEARAQGGSGLMKTAENNPH